MEEKIFNILSEIDEDIVTYEGDLFDAGLLDSFLVIEVVSELEEVFDIEIDAKEVITENFNTKEKIVELIKRLLDTKAGKL